jgi:hypothetical protein
LEGLLKVACESWSKHVLVRAKLMSRLSNNRIDHIKSRYFVLWSTLHQEESMKRVGLAVRAVVEDGCPSGYLGDESFDTLHDVLVHLDPFDRGLGDCAHFGFGNRRFNLVQRGQLNSVGLEESVNIK